jgi:hypothetical protein
LWKLKGNKVRGIGLGGEEGERQENMGELSERDLPLYVWIDD